MDRLQRKIARLQKRIMTLSAVDAGELKKENAQLLENTRALSRELLEAYSQQLLVTRESDAALRAELLRESILEYCKQKGYDPAEILGEK